MKWRAKEIVGAVERPDRSLGVDGLLRRAAGCEFCGVGGADLRRGHLQSWANQCGPTGIDVSENDLIEMNRSYAIFIEVPIWLD